jgi:hypothetical protein
VEWQARHGPLRCWLVPERLFRTGQLLDLRQRLRQQWRRQQLLQQQTRRRVRRHGLRNTLSSRMRCLEVGNSQTEASCRLWRSFLQTRTWRILCCCPAPLLLNVGGPLLLLQLLVLLLLLLLLWLVVLLRGQR